MEASLSTLILSIGSSAAMALGIEDNPQTGKKEQNIPVAQFNIDLLIKLHEKTKGNLTDDENQLLEKIIADLQLKFIDVQKIQRKTEDI